MSESIKAFAPATVANVACGFDVMGFSVEQPGDEVVVRKTNGKGTVITKIEGDGGKLPLDPAQNTVSLVIDQYLQHLDMQIGVEIEIRD